MFITVNNPTKLAKHTHVNNDKNFTSTKPNKFGLWRDSEPRSFYWKWSCQNEENKLGLNHFTTTAPMFLQFNWNFQCLFLFVKNDFSFTRIREYDLYFCQNSSALLEKKTDFHHHLLLRRVSPVQICWNVCTSFNRHTDTTVIDTKKALLYTEW